MPALLRDRSQGGARVTNTELFFDLVYVFAITQLSARLVHEPTLHNAAQTALLLAMVWMAWVYTTWSANWLDPDQTPTRVMLLLVMLASLLLSAGIPTAFGGPDEPDRGLWVGGAYAAMQIGRSAYTVWATRGDQVRTNYLRILSWCVLSGALALAGAFAHGHARELLWLAAVLVDVLGGFARFWTPWLGRSQTSEWTIDGGHFAERCQLFLIIALGESLVATGTRLSEAEHVDTTLVVAFVGAFAGAVAFFWLYFDRSAEQGVAAISASDDPGRIATSAYHYVHPLMIAGIVLSAVGDETVLHDPGHHATHGTAWFVAGGSALFALGHAIYVRLVRERSYPVPHAVAVLLLLVLAVVGSHVTALTVGLSTFVVLVALLVADGVLDRRTNAATPA